MRHRLGAPPILRENRSRLSGQADLLQIAVGHLHPTFERLFEPFEIHDGVVIPPGSYWFHRGRAEFSTAENKPVGLEAPGGSAPSTTAPITN
jgi:hypothetical protein